MFTDLIKKGGKSHVGVEQLHNLNIIINHTEQQNMEEKNRQNYYDIRQN